MAPNNCIIFCYDCCWNGMEMRSPTPKEYCWMHFAMTLIAVISQPSIQTEERRPLNPADDEKYSKAVHFSADSIVDCGWRAAGRSTISGGRTIMMNCRLGLGYERALVLFGSMSIQYLFIYIYMCTGFNETQCNTPPLLLLLLLVVFIVMVGD